MVFDQIAQHLNGATLQSDDLIFTVQQIHIGWNAERGKQQCNLRGRGHKNSNSVKLVRRSLSYLMPKLTFIPGAVEEHSYFFDLREHLAPLAMPLLYISFQRSGKA